MHNGTGYDSYFLLDNNPAYPSIVNLRGTSGLEQHRLLSPFSFDRLRPTLPPSFVLLRPYLRLCSFDCLRLFLLLLGFSPRLSAISYPEVLDPEQAVKELSGNLMTNTINWICCALAGGPLMQARNFAVMTGVNAGISCVMKRLRGFYQKKIERQGGCSI
ncbi:unnamed protein product [Prunus armeniaca]